MALLKHQLVRVSHLHLSPADWHLANILAVRDSIPAYRYSAAFLSTLRSNIHLSTHSDCCSYPATPTMSTFSASHLTHPTPDPLSLSSSISSNTPTTSLNAFPSPRQQHPSPLPALSTYPTTSPPERTSALHLIADSIAQQRQLTASTILTHPYTLALIALFLALFAKSLSIYTFITTAAGATMTLLLTVRWIASPYLTLAEAINLHWLDGVPLPPGSKGGRRRSGGHGRSASTGSNSSHTGGNVEPAATTITTTTSISNSTTTTSNSNGGNGKGGRRRSRHNSSSGPDVENVVVVTRWGGADDKDNNIIGALVMRVWRKERKALVRAWTVERRYRGHGVGRALLEEGVRVVKGKVLVGGIGGGGAVPEVRFEGGHANSHRVLPGVFNTGVERRERRARKVLEEVLAEQQHQHQQEVGR
ncbi:MAG: hypothetical protein LQ345_000678 [Seirophora villosa]|nr:MAG: hypothetical protein LQ345_000678 [Seirophora villosa]